MSRLLDRSVGEKRELEKPDGTTKDPELTQGKRHATYSLAIEAAGQPMMTPNSDCLLQRDQTTMY